LAQAILAQAAAGQLHVAHEGVFEVARDGI